MLRCPSRRAGSLPVTEAVLVVRGPSRAGRAGVRPVPRWDNRGAGLSDGSPRVPRSRGGCPLRLQGWWGSASSVGRREAGKHVLRAGRDVQPCSRCLSVGEGEACVHCSLGNSGRSAEHRGGCFTGSAGGSEVGFPAEGSPSAPGIPCVATPAPKSRENPIYSASSVQRLVIPS